MANEYLVSVPGLGEFHRWCRAMNQVPNRDAKFVPLEPPARRAQYLEGCKVESADRLIGDFTDAEKAQLIEAVAPAKAGRNKAAEEALPEAKEG